MKIYTSKFEMAKPTDMQIWTPQFSKVALGIKVEKNGVDKEFIVKNGSTTLSAEADKINGYTIFNIDTQAPGRIEYSISAETQIMTLRQNITDTTVYEQGGAGGSTGETYTFSDGLTKDASNNVTLDNNATLSQISATADDEWYLGDTKVLNIDNRLPLGSSPIVTCTESQWSVISSAADPDMLYFVSED